MKPGLNQQVQIAQQSPSNTLCFTFVPVMFTAQDVPKWYNNIVVNVFTNSGDITAFSVNSKGITNLRLLKDGEYDVTIYYSIYYLYKLVIRKDSGGIIVTKTHRFNNGVVSISNPDVPVPEHTKKPVVKIMHDSDYQSHRWIDWSHNQSQEFSINYRSLFREYMHYGQIDLEDSADQLGIMLGTTRMARVRQENSLLKLAKTCSMLDRDRKVSEFEDTPSVAERGRELLKLALTTSNEKKIKKLTRTMGGIIHRIIQGSVEIHENQNNSFPVSDMIDKQMEIIAEGRKLCQSFYAFNEEEAKLGNLMIDLFFDPAFDFWATGFTMPCPIADAFLSGLTN